MNLRDTYNKIAEDWYKDHHADDWWHEGTDTLVSLLPSAAHVVDVGCGAGHKTKYLLEKGCRVTAVDFSEKLLVIAKREAPRARFVLSDMRELSVVIEPIDAIFSQASLLHIHKREAAALIAYWTGLLRPEGYLYIAVKGIQDGQSEEQIVTENDYGYEYERFFSFYTPEEIRQYMMDSDLEIVYENVARVDSTDWIQVIGKKVVG